MSWSRIRAIFLRNFYVQGKGLGPLCDLFYWPLMDILLWGLTSVWIEQQNHVPNLPLILMTGLIFWQVTWRGSVDISVGMLHEIWNRNLINLFSTPLKISEWGAGLILLSFCKLLVTIAFGSVVVYLLYALNVFTIGWVFLPFAASLLLFGFALGFISSGLIIYWGHQIEVVAWMVGFIFAPFSAVFYPLHALPTWAQVISVCLPTTYIFEGMRSILTTGAFPYENFLISIGLNILYLGLAVAFFCFMFEKSRAKGLARLE